MIVFVKTLLLTVTSVCVRACASRCSRVFVHVSVRDAQRREKERERERKSLNACASVFACLCAPN